MAQLRWNDIELFLPNNNKSIKEISQTVKIKKKSDKTSSTEKITGFELQSIPIEYTVIYNGREDATDEYKKLRKNLGLSGVLYLDEYQIGPNNLMLQKVTLRADKISNNGIVIVGTIVLNFEENPTQKKDTAQHGTYQTTTPRSFYQEPEKAVEEADLNIKYNGVDITGDVDVNSCIHNMYACSQTDKLIIRFNDTNHLWDSWAPNNEDLISSQYGIATSGNMYIHSIKPENGLMTLKAYSIPPTADKSNEKSWENVKFTQLAEEIAARHGLGFEKYGVEDYLYSYVRQDNESDFEFLQKRCDLESCAFVIYDKKLVIYSEEYLENQEPVDTIELNSDSDFSFENNELLGLGKLYIRNGKFVGSYTSSNGLSRTDTRQIQTYIGSQAEADRFAKGICRQDNKYLLQGNFKDNLMRQYSAGSIANLNISGTSSWNGKIFIHQVRHDYVDGYTKIFFRKANIV